jgi:DNA invertase Pin-like site-specific DNA recombinase
MKLGYARVSTDEQNLDLQRHALEGAGCENIVEDRVSGAAVNRPALDRALAAMQEGDVLVVWKLDRLGRDLRHLVNLIHDLTARGIGFKVLEGHGAEIDTTTANGRLIFGIFAALAEFERELIRERTRAGMQAARKRGVHLGRPPKLAAHQVEHARALIAGGKTRGEVAALLGVSPKTLRRALRSDGETEQVRGKGHFGRQGTNG